MIIYLYVYVKKKFERDKAMINSYFYYISPLMPDTLMKLMIIEAFNKACFGRHFSVISVEHWEPCYGTGIHPSTSLS